MKRMICILAAPYLLVILLIVIVGSYTDYARRLPNGYYVQYIHSDFCIIVHDDVPRFIVGPHVTKWTVDHQKVNGDLVDGRSYVLDTETGAVTYSHKLH